MDLKHFTVREELFESPALRDNPAGDPSARRVPVILPRGHGGDGARRYPVVFFLSGYGGSGASFLNWKPWTPSLPERIDRLRAQGRIGDVIVVCPDAFTVYGGSQYINSTATGAYEDMIVRDLVEWVDGRFATAAAPGHRALVGKSSGGYGALVLGMRHPDVFSAVACHSGDMYFEYCYRSDFPHLLRQLDEHGSLDAFMNAFFEAPKKTSALFSAMSIVAMAAAYSPDPSRPWRVALPVDPKTGEILDEVWERWLEHDPVRLCERHAAALRSLRLLYLECGRRDEYHLQYGLRILTRKLRALEVPHEHLEFDDGHSDTSYRYDESLPRVWDAIRTEAS